MITTSSGFPGFRQFFMNLLTVYQRDNDTYKDIYGVGLFERYMSLFGESIDYEQAEQIDNYLDIIDAAICDEKFLIHLSDVLGNPPDIFLNNDQYRNLLLYITNVYKVKGTSRGYLLFFYILGFIVTVTEVEPTQTTLTYDAAGKLYDEEENPLLYDTQGCQMCSVYHLRIEKIGDVEFTLDDNTLSKMLDAIKFNEPINANLGIMTIVLNITDVIELEMVDDTELIPTSHPLYDYDPLHYDMDDPIVPEYD
jgi:hypothetical protein